MGKRSGDRGGGHGPGGCLVRLRADDCGLRRGLGAARPVAALKSAALQALNEPVRGLLRRAGIAGPAEVPHVEPLGGGVSSDIWRVDLASGPVCVKCALPRLRVAQVWEAPIERSRYEYEWFRIAAAAVPGAVPQVIAQEGGVLAMQYLDPARHPVWKDLLRKGHADAGFASKVGRSLAAIHSATANQKEVERRFASDDIFYAIRLEPYLVATAAAHPDLEANLLGLLARTAITKLCLVHGDVSPKNILVGPRGPVFLDAECAWFGDPAFDLAFCLNHLLLKCIWVPACADRFLGAYDALKDAYLERVTWEQVDTIEQRTARLLPALLLGRIDGKSPVEYIVAESDKAIVREVATTLIVSHPTSLAEIRDAWARHLRRD